MQPRPYPPVDQILSIYLHFHYIHCKRFRLHQPYFGHLSSRNAYYLNQSVVEKLPPFCYISISFQKAYKSPGEVLGCMVVVEM